PHGKKGQLPGRQAEADLLTSKLSPDLVELIGMKEKPQTYSKGKITMKNREVTIQIWLNRSGDEISKLLEEKGLKMTFKAATGKMVIGTISMERLEELAKLNEVRFIEPFAIAS